MVLSNWRKFIADLDRFFERKQTPIETVTLWFDEVKHLPAEFLPFAAKEIRGKEFFPRNLPWAVLQLWPEWLKANPQRLEPERMEDCPGCADGKGWIRCWRQNKLYDSCASSWVAYVVRCTVCNPHPPELLAECQKRNRKPEWAATISQVEERGYHVGTWPQGGYPWPKDYPQGLGMINLQAPEELEDVPF